VLLIGLALLIQRFDVRPVEGRTILSLVTEGSIGNGWLYLVIQLSTVLLLALAAKLARDDYLPHVFGLRADRFVHRHGVLVLAVLSGALLIGTEGRVDVLVPLFAIGVLSASRCSRPTGRSGGPRCRWCCWTPSTGCWARRSPATSTRWRTSTWWC